MNAPTDPQTLGRVPSQREEARPPRQYDVLDVTLHDDELIAETELTALLMIAVNDSADSDFTGLLPQDEIDQLLGLRA